MNERSLSKLKGTLIVPAGLAMVLVPFSLLIESNLVTLIMFWFLITPGLAAYLPTLISKRKNHFVESLLGLIIFYAIMVFMIYDHYETDYFQIMIVSCMINLITVSVISLLKKPATLIH